MNFKFLLLATSLSLMISGCSKGAEEASKQEETKVSESSSVDKKDTEKKVEKEKEEVATEVEKTESESTETKVEEVTKVDSEKKEETKKEETKKVATTTQPKKETTTTTKKVETKPSTTQPTQPKKETTQPKPTPSQPSKPAPSQPAPKPSEPSQPKPAPAPVVKTINVNDLFQMRSASGLSAQQRLDAHNSTMADSEMKYYVEQINKEFNKYIQGSFSWDYRNSNNKSNFLAFRAGGYFYDNASLQADQLYSKIHQKVNEHQLIITPSFNYNIQDIFVHPTRGGYVVSQVLSLKYTSANGSKIEGWEPNKWYSVRYEVEFNFNSANTSWSMWNYGEYGRLTTGFDYKVGNFN